MKAKHILTICSILFMWSGSVFLGMKVGGIMVLIGLIAPLVLIVNISDMIKNPDDWKSKESE